MSKKTKIKRTNKHHKKSRARGGTNDPTNLVLVPTKTHRFYHAFFAEGTYPPDMARKLNVWIDPDWVMLALPIEDIKKIQKYLTQLNH
jgi:hypothetical protein